MRIFDNVRRALGTSKEPPQRPSVTAQVSDWTILGEDIARQYAFRDTAGAETEFQVRCTVKMGGMGFLTHHVHFFLRPAFVQQECYLVAFLGTMDQQVESGFFPVKVAYLDGGANLIWVEDQQAAQKCLAVLAACKLMTFMLNDKQHCLLKLPLENDASYRTVFADLQERIGGTQSSAAVSRGASLVWDVTSAVANLKENTDISYVVILPSLLSIATRLRVQQQGVGATVQQLADLLAVIERKGHVPASALMGVNYPEQPLSHRAQVDEILWQLARQLSDTGHSTDSIAMTFTGLALRLAEEKVDNFYAMALLKQAHRDLSRESL